MDGEGLARVVTRRIVMVAFANLDPRPQCKLEPEPVLLPSTEASLTPAYPVAYGEYVSALIELDVTGDPSSTLGWIVLQHDPGEGNWVDVAWSTFRRRRGLALLVLQGGDRVQAARRPERPPGQAPEPPAGSHPVVLYGRFRFVGQAEFTGGRSPVATCIIRWKRMGLWG
jgi:hypothetical protein